MTEIDKNPLNLVYKVRSDATRLFHECREISDEDTCLSFSTFTRAFKSTPNFFSVYRGNFEDFNGRSRLDIKYTDGEYKWKKMGTIYRYKPGILTLSQYTRYSGIKLSIARFVFEDGLIPTYRQEYYPNALLLNGSAINGRAAKLDGHPDNNDLISWCELIEDAKKFSVINS